MPSQPFSPGSEYFERRALAMPALDSERLFGRIVAESFPGIALLDEDMRPAAYDALVDTYLMRNIRDLTQVTNELKFRRFLVGAASLTGRSLVYAELARIADVDQKTAKAWLALLTNSYLVKILEPYANNVLRRLVKQPIMHFVDTGLVAHLAGWGNVRALEVGASGGHFLETYAFTKVYKSYANSGRWPRFSFFRNNARREIDMLLEREGILYP